MMLTGQLISKAACKMEICGASENTMVEFFVAKSICIFNIVLTPSEHASFAQLFDLRTGGGGGRLGLYMVQDWINWIAPNGLEKV